MKVPLQVTFRNVDHSDAIDARVRERVGWLEEFNDQIISCRVVVGLPHKHHLTGNICHVSVNLRVPGQEIVVNRSPDLQGAHKDMYIAIHDTFDEVRRRLEDYTRMRRRDVKRSVLPPTGRIVRLKVEDEEYGFLMTDDGREIYFHSNSVIGNNYDKLEVGTEVRFSEEMGEKGPQASSVEIVGEGKQKHTQRAA
jgi:cold shock CspA family protein/ribosome-associated translation inhibitor RaiA